MILEIFCAALIGLVMFGLGHALGCSRRVDPPDLGPVPAPDVPADLLGWNHSGPGLNFSGVHGLSVSVHCGLGLNDLGDPPQSDTAGVCS